MSDHAALQIDLWGDIIEQEDKGFLSEQLITYIGNKRSLLDFIGQGLNVVKKRIGKNRVKCLDLFSGSGVVSRYLKQHSSLLIANDIERYVEVINSCYLMNKTDVPFQKIKKAHGELTKILSDDQNLKDGFIRNLYSPYDHDSIKHGERCFYTPRNAKYIDTARQLINTLPEDLQKYFLAPLLSSASVHTNTSGVFKGFYKNTETGLGQFGGNNRNALTRILGNIELKLPLFSNFECDFQVCRDDANKIIEWIDEVDVAYIDPPYNQHPYGSNYFMLNLIADYVPPDEISGISGIPKNWYRSHYNKTQKAHDAIKDLVEKIKAKYLLISFNSEGFITVEAMLNILNGVGKVDVIETKYNAFRGSRNLFGRDTHVKEYLYLVEKR